MIGLGLLVVKNNVHKDVAQPMMALAVLGMAIGIGFVLSAVVSYVLSRKLGLWGPPASLTEESSNV